MSSIRILVRAWEVKPGDKVEIVGSDLPPFVVEHVDHIDSFSLSGDKYGTRANGNVVLWHNEGRAVVSASARINCIEDSS
jgi:hypothetical protein